MGAVMAAGSRADGHLSPPVPPPISVATFSHRVAELAAYAALFPSTGRTSTIIPSSTSTNTSTSSSPSPSVPATVTEASPPAETASAVEVSSLLQLPVLPSTTTDQPIPHLLSDGIGAMDIRFGSSLLGDGGIFSGTLSGMGVAAGGGSGMVVGSGCGLGIGLEVMGYGGGFGPELVAPGGGCGFGDFDVVGDGHDGVVGDLFCGRSVGVEVDVRAVAVFVGFGGGIGDGNAGFVVGSGGDSVHHGASGAVGGGPAGDVVDDSGGRSVAAVGGVRPAAEAQSCATLASAVALVAWAMAGCGGPASSSPSGGASPSTATAGGASPSPPPSPALHQVDGRRQL